MTYNLQTYGYVYFRNTKKIVVSPPTTVKYISMECWSIINVKRKKT